MNKSLTSKEAILFASKKIASEAGLESFSMREVAKQCGIAVGSVYNYFPSKGELTAATVESIWNEIMCGANFYAHSDSFISGVEHLFSTAQKGTANYPNFFSIHISSFTADEKGHGRNVMGDYFIGISQNLLSVLERDPHVSPTAFDSDFTKDSFLSFVIKSILMLLKNNAKDCNILIHMIRKAIY